MNVFVIISTAKQSLINPSLTEQNLKEALTNSTDPEDIHKNATYHQSLHCLLHSLITTISGDCNIKYRTATPSPKGHMNHSTIMYPSW